MDVYNDPVKNSQVDVPNNYDRAWTNGSEYIFSEDPDFDPNTNPGPN